MAQVAFTLENAPQPRIIRYVPILKAKDAEYRALGDLTPHAQASIVPLLEVPSIPWDYENDGPAKSIDAHLAPVANRIAGVWAAPAIAYIDLALVADDLLSDGRHPLEAVMENAVKTGAALIPVIGLDRSKQYQAAARAAAARDRRGVCLRLEPDALLSAAAEPLTARVDAALSDVGLAAPDIDLVLDLGSIRGDDTAVLAVAWTTLWPALPRLMEWRSVTFAATAFPQSLTGLTPNAITRIPRGEWSLYSSLRNAALPRQPDFGDYAIAHPEPVEMDPRLMKISAQVRYAAPTEWLVVRGRNTKDYGWGQMHGLAAKLIAEPEFAKAPHCWGDEFIQRCAIVSTSESGNAMTWRRVGTVHHLTTVVEQLTTASWL